MLFEIRFSGDSNLKDSKYYFVQPYWQPLRVTLVMGDHSQNAKVGDISDLPTSASHPV